MPTIKQLIRNTRQPVRNVTKSPALGGCPQSRGTCSGINAVIRESTVSYSYSRLITNLYKRQLLLNRKMLAQIAILNRNCLYMISNDILK